MERRGRGHAIGGLVSREEVGVRLPGRRGVVAKAKIRSREVHASRLRQCHEVIHEDTVGTNPDHVFQTSDPTGLLDDEVTRGLEDREEDEFGGTSSDLGEDRGLVGVASVGDRRGVHRNRSTGNR